jgi:hypothetical protein
VGRETCAFPRLCLDNRPVSGVIGKVPGPARPDQCPPVGPLGRRPPPVHAPLPPTA